MAVFSLLPYPMISSLEDLGPFTSYLIVSKKVYLKTNVTTEVMVLLGLINHAPIFFKTEMSGINHLGINKMKIDEHYDEF